MEDTVRAVLRTPDGAPVDIALDYLSRDYRRGIEVVGPRRPSAWTGPAASSRSTTGSGCRPPWLTSRSTAATRPRPRRSWRWLGGADDLPVDVETALASLRLADEIRDRST